MTAAALGLVLLAVGADPAPAAREVIDLGPGGPVRAKVRVTVAGRPADAVWADAVEALFAFLDRDKDGELSQAERVVFAPPRGRPEFVDPETGLVGSPLRLSFPRDEKVTREAFTAALKAAGFGPVAMSSTQPTADSERLSAAPFKHLDADGDGKLSPAELANARDRLAPLDADEDEILTAAELLNRTANPTGRVVAFPGAMAAERTNPSENVAFLIPDGGPLVKQLLVGRAGRNATFLRPVEFGGESKAFAALDQDGNGKLDTAELAAWLDRRPDLELTYDFPADGTGKLTGPPDVAVPGVRLRAEPPTEADRPKAGWDKTAEQLRAALKPSGSAERKKFERLPAELVLFELADRNADGKVDAAEVDAAVKVLGALVRCRTTVTLVDEGSGLFELLDRNGDGRLTPRELVNAPVVLKAYGATVGPKDLPRRLSLHVAVASLPIVPVGFAPPPVMPAAADPNPAWFTSMDRNGDGDVSRREFVGPLAAFAKLDADGDGLLSASEARAAGR